MDEEIFPLVLNVKRLFQDQEERVNVNIIDVATECYMATEIVFFLI